MIFLLYGLLWGLTAFVFWIYGLDPDAFWYLTTLQVLVCAVWWALRQIRKRNRQKELARLCTVPGLPTLEYNGDRVEQAWQNLANHLEQKRRRQQEDFREQCRQLEQTTNLWIHQTKLPLQAMKLLIQEETADHTEMEHQLFKLEQYTEMALCVCRLHAENTDYILKRQPLDPILRSTIRHFAKAFILQNISLHYEGTDSTCITDSKWLGFIVEQLLSNALKYTRTTVSVTADHSAIRIQDDGPGIPAEDLAHIWERGITGTNGHNHPNSSGLGLWLARQTAKGLNLQLELINEPGKGCCAVIHLPQLKDWPGQ